VRAIDTIERGRIPETRYKESEHYDVDFDPSIDIITASGTLYSLHEGNLYKEGRLVMHVWGAFIPQDRRERALFTGEYDGVECRVSTSPVEWWRTDTAINVEDPKEVWRHNETGALRVTPYGKRP